MQVPVRNHARFESAKSARSLPLYVIMAKRTALQDIVVKRNAKKMQITYHYT